MHSPFVIRLGLVVCAIVSASTGKDGKENLMEKCHNENINYAEAMKGKIDCKGEKNTKCVCHLKKWGLLNDDGQFSESGLQSYADKIYLEKNRNDAVNGINQCTKEHLTEFSMTNDNAACKEFRRCLLEADMKACGYDWKAMKGKGKGKSKKH